MFFMFVFFSHLGWTLETVSFFFWPFLESEIFFWPTDLSSIADKVLADLYFYHITSGWPCDKSYETAQAEPTKTIATASWNREMLNHLLFGILSTYV